MIILIVIGVILYALQVFAVFAVRDEGQILQTTTGVILALIPLPLILLYSILMRFFWYIEWRIKDGNK
jgi:hypothetical protein